MQTRANELQVHWVLLPRFPANDARQIAESGLNLIAEADFGEAAQRAVAEAVKAG